MAANQAAQNALVLVIKTIIETIQDCGPMGAPGGHLYAGLMSHMSLDTFESVMALACKTGKITKRGQVYYAVK